MSRSMTHAWIGLGSNLAQPVEQILRALNELGALPDTQLLKQSSLFRSPPMGPQDQPDFINAVALVETRLEPLELLEMLKGIERAHQRQPTRYWGERTLDLDLLVYGDCVLEQPALTVPHPGIPHRAFVLYPLVEVSPELDIPVFGPVTELLAALPLEAVARRLEHPE